MTAATDTTVRDSGIDTMRGIAILMVIGIHSLQQPLLPAWENWFDAALRPCVPVFLFASGYLTMLSGRVPLTRRLTALLIPYAIAFAAACLYMALHNSAMDLRLGVTAARFVLAYVFVYYYVFVYAGCTLMAWLVFRAGRGDPQRLAMMLLISIGVGLFVGAYLDPLLARVHASDAVIEEVRMRDIPFWFGFVALGGMAGHAGARSTIRQMRWPLTVLMLASYVAYAAVRWWQIGDAGDYDSTAFFGYAALLCLVLRASDLQIPALAALGSGSYFIYLWHIFVVMALRDHGGLRALGPGTSSAITAAVTIATSVTALLLTRRLAAPRVARWLGA
jgi:surface polysaccharide O-acyltransferase-like enzyme